ncbi:Hypp3238 [Branchiostoma lanceolatum]|uniref:Hypp3238 protein n=1 Tax=Branchiostoma lanceolatum TaxID=7740 RepID=A0A8K0EWZ9_BRALA|nr:Hypp3238 [Branchiostoma lanceolatum]
MFDSKNGLSAGLTGNGSECVRCHAGAAFEAAQPVKEPPLIRPVHLLLSPAKPGASTLLHSPERKPRYGRDFKGGWQEKDPAML